VRELFGESSVEKDVSVRKMVKGKVELAGGGTLFIDDVQCAPPPVQIRLIHLIAERGFESPGGGEWTAADVRLIVGTSGDLEFMLDTWQFRSDLYHRFQDSRITLRPLRDCKDAIPSMLGACLRMHSSEGGSPVEISDEAMRIMCEYDWPGNVVELESCISHAVARSGGGKVRPSHLPSSIVEGTELTEMISNALDDVEKRHIMTVLERCSWNKHQAARELEISKSTLYSKISKYSLVRQGAKAN
jgi:DNA-binding NtrC family response regulator